MEFGRANNGDIAPAENQATAILPAISEVRDNWPTENFVINNTLPYYKSKVNGHGLFLSISKYR